LLPSAIAGRTNNPDEGAFAPEVTVLLRLAVVLLIASISADPQGRTNALRGGDQGFRPVTSLPQGTAILRAEEARAATPQDLAILVDGARSSIPIVQDAAIRALGRLERRDVVTELLPYLRAERDDARLEAAFAIGQAMRGATLPLDPNDTQVGGVQQALLSAAAGERKVLVLGEMLRTLARLPYRTGDQVQKAERFLQQVLGRPGADDAADAAEIKRAAALAFEIVARMHRKLAPFSDDTVAALRAIVTARDPSVKPTDVPLRTAAMQALTVSGGADAETLRVALDDAFSTDIRRLAVLALQGGSSPTSSEERLALLRKRFEDRAQEVRLEALRAYVRHYAKTEGCGPVVDLLADPGEHVVLYALDALGDCADDQNVLNRLVFEARMPPDIGNWRRASHALVSLAKRAPSLLEIPIVTHARHDVWQVRMYAARAAAIGNDVAMLERLASDPHDNVREATLGALRRLKGDAAAQYFLDALERRDYQLLRTAAREMAGMRATRELTRALLSALLRVTAEQKDTSRDTRLAILERLREFGNANHAEALLPLLRDFDPKVAAAVAATLHAWTGQTYAVDPQPFPPQELPSASELAILHEKVALFKMDSGIEFAVRLDPVRAPLMGTRFLRLVNRHYYDGLTFHRVVPNFIIQGGSPGANEYVGDGPYVKDEISVRSHVRGTVGLSTRGRDTGDAQLFINLVDNPRLDFEYTVFGHVLAEHVERVERIQEGDRILGITFIEAGPRTR
jgi:cyclophilin family peptidyl-prolyl cis-trans isomerase/HEAT repeat protein